MSLILQNGHDPLENIALQSDIFLKLKPRKVLFLQLGEANGSEGTLNYQNFHAQVMNAFTFTETLNSILETEVDAPIVVDSEFIRMGADTKINNGEELKNLNLDTYCNDDNPEDVQKLSVKLRSDYHQSIDMVA
tara:strand:+ start:159 stop:560 length:402 start_codon:yes stop_codon:yes gene_type:complete